MTPEALLEQAATGAAVFEATARDAAEHDGLTQPSGLPGWTQAYVVAHVARNADALVNLLTWARTGVPTPMYASREARAAQIEADAQRPDGELLEDVTAASARFARAAAATGGDCWLVPVQTALGKTVPASAVPWTRTREVWVHAVDLGGAVTLADVPLPVTELLLDDAVADFAGAEAARIFGRVTAAIIAAGRTPWRRIADLMIAAIAIAEELPLFTTNPDDFAGLADLLTVVPVTRPRVPPHHPAGTSFGQG